jgi:hypothetical protein
MLVDTQSSNCAFPLVARHALPGDPVPRIVWCCLQNPQTCPSLHCLLLPTQPLCISTGISRELKWPPSLPVYRYRTFRYTPVRILTSSLCFSFRAVRAGPPLSALAIWIFQKF